ncbi:MAG TPA: hypothetical protein VFV70_02780, partial [Hyphomonadaceae bacterium]|nr:hypothetical protein [Hyphomonadaceae bacterium]
FALILQDERACGANFRNLICLTTLDSRHGSRLPGLKSQLFFPACAAKIYRLSIRKGQAAVSAETGAESAVVEVLFF